MVIHSMETENDGLPSLYSIVVSKKIKDELHAITILVCLLLAGCGFASLSTFPYFVMYFIWMLGIATLNSANPNVSVVSHEVNVHMRQHYST